MKKIYATRFIALIFAMSTALFAPGARADMGGVVSQDAKVSEEGQKAIILHNGEEEVLILGTDMKSDKKAGMIRFIPFPSEPQVSLAPEKAFDAATALIKKYALKTMARSKSGYSLGRPLELVFNRKLGAHDVTVIKVNDVAGFRSWANNFFKKKGLPQKESYPEVEKVVGEYVKRGIAYFMFDFVELGAEPRSVEPVMFRFKNKELYYPLLTSNTFGGEGAINLIIVCPRTIGTMFEGRYPGLTMTETSTSAKTGVNDLKEIFPAAADFFKGQPRLYMQLINYFGPYSFTEDFTADIAKGVDYEVYFEEGGSFQDDVIGSLLDRLPEDRPVIGQEFEKFICYNNYFTAEVPKGWPQSEDITDSEATKEYGVDLRGEKSVEGMYLVVSLTYFGPDHGMFKTPEAYIERNSVVDDGSRELGQNTIEVKTTAVAGRRAYQFEKRSFKSIPPGAVNPKKVPVVERVVVVPANEGFYVLRYTAPMTISDSYINIFKIIVESFKPNV